MEQRNGYRELWRKSQGFGNVLLLFGLLKERERGTNLKPLEQRRHRRKEGEEILDFRDSVLHGTVIVLFNEINKILNQIKKILFGFFKKN